MGAPVDMSVFRHERTWSLCFSPYDQFTYYDCCRDVDPAGRTPLHHICFDDEFTYERCCDFRFGPEIRGLPYTGSLHPRGLARLDVGSAGRVVLKLGPRCVDCPFDGINQIWMTSWYWARLMADAKAIIDIGSLLWPQMRNKFRGPRARLSVARLRTLDIGCGVGAASIAAARLGHNATCTDIDPGALHLAARNAMLNGVKLGTVQRWDMTEPAPPAVLDRGPFDVAFIEMGPILVRALGAHEVDYRLLETRLYRLLRNLQGLRISTVLMHGNYRADGQGPDFWTAAAMHLFQNFAAYYNVTEPCVPPDRGRRYCVRMPVLSPFDFLEKLGLGPPVRHGWVLW